MLLLWHFFPLWRCGLKLAMASSLLRFLDHSQRRTAVGRIPLDEWSALRRDLYLTIHNTHDKLPRRGREVLMRGLQIYKTWIILVEECQREPTGSSGFLWKVGTPVPDYTVTNPGKIQKSSRSQTWIPQTPHILCRPFFFSTQKREIYTTHARKFRCCHFSEQGRKQIATAKCNRLGHTHTHTHTHTHKRQDMCLTAADKLRGSAINQFQETRLRNWRRNQLERRTGKRVRRK